MPAIGGPTKGICDGVSASFGVQRGNSHKDEVGESIEHFASDLPYSDRRAKILGIDIDKDVNYTERTNDDRHRDTASHNSDDVVCQREQADMLAAASVSSARKQYA